MKKIRKRAARGTAKSYFEKKYGITAVQREAMIALRHGCWVCGGDNGGRSLNVDHDHKTSRVRGMLCFRCNKWTVGRHRDGALLRAAADYLDSNFDGRKL